MRTEVILTCPHHEPSDDLRHPLPFFGHKGSMCAQHVGGPGEVEHRSTVMDIGPTADHW